MIGVRPLLLPLEDGTNCRFSAWADLFFYFYVYKGFPHLSAGPLEATDLN